MADYEAIRVNLERLRKDLEEVFNPSNNTNNYEYEKEI